jgi:hypothetical protein
LEKTRSAVRSVGTSGQARAAEAKSNKVPQASKTQALTPSSGG